MQDKKDNKKTGKYRNEIAGVENVGLENAELNSIAKSQITHTAENVHCESKKTRHYNIVHNFAKC